MNTDILDRQSLLDLALQLHGDISTALNLAEANNLPLTPLDKEQTPGTGPVIGQTLEYTPADIVERTVTNLYANRRHTPATALDPGLFSGDGAILLEGIEYWGIQYDFIVS